MEKLCLLLVSCALWIVPAPVATAAEGPKGGVLGNSVTQWPTVEINGLRVIRLEKFIELKLASGTTPGRLKDLGDVQELIRLLHLPEEFDRQLSPMVQALYLHLWREVHNSPSSQ